MTVPKEHADASSLTAGMVMKLNILTPILYREFKKLHEIKKILCYMLTLLLKGILVYSNALNFLLG